MPGSGRGWHNSAMTDLPDIEDAKLMLGAAAIVLGQNHAATLALARAVTTGKQADIEDTRLALRRLDRGMREAIADAVEHAWEGEED